MFSLRGGSRVWSLALILCIGFMVVSSSAFATDSDRSRFATDSDRSRFSPLSFGNITTQLLDLASTEVIARAACAVFGYRLFSSVFDVEQNTEKTMVMEPVNRTELSKKVLTCKLAGCNPLLDIGL